MRPFSFGEHNEARWERETEGANLYDTQTKEEDSEEATGEEGSETAMGHLQRVDSAPLRMVLKTASFGIRKYRYFSVSTCFWCRCLQYSKTQDPPPPNHTMPLAIVPCV